MPATSSFAALPIAHVLLRILMVLNWRTGAAILTLLLARVFAEGTLMREDLEGTV